MLKILLDAGADVTIKNTHDEMPLHVAARQGNLLALATLIEHDAQQINAEGREKRTPLYTAAAHSEYEAVKMLLGKFKADPNSRNRISQLGIVHVAVDENAVELIKILADNHADLNMLDLARQSPLCRAIVKNNYIKEVLREYLSHPSSDGAIVRQQLREELEELVK